jgi:heme-degrading monooxygenase HmoA
VFARLTLLEIDTVRIPTEAAVEVFKQEVLPDLQKQPGYLGVLVMSTPVGRGALLSFWESEEAAEAGATSGWYPEELERYMTLFKSPPGRERYEVAFADLPTEIFAASG